MVNVENVKLLVNSRVTFNFRVTDEETSELQTVVVGCSIYNGYLNGPAVKLSSGRWMQVNEFYGAYRSAILKALEPFRAQYPGVQWPKEA